VFFHDLDELTRWKVALSNVFDCPYSACSSGFSRKMGEVQFDGHRVAEPRLSGSGFPAIA